MDDIELNLKIALLNERERIEGSTLETKQEKIRLLHQKQWELNKDISKLSIEIRDMKYVEDRKWNFKGQKEEEREEERLSTFAI
jgi:hypothetical protein